MRVNKVLRTLLLSMAAMLFIVQVAFGATNATYVLFALDDEPPEQYTEDPATIFSGYNYEARFTVPQIDLYVFREDKDITDPDEGSCLSDKVSFDISWRISPDIRGLNLWVDNDTDDSGTKFEVLYLGGVLPSVSSAMEFPYTIVAEVVSCDDIPEAVGVCVELDDNYNIAVEPDEEHSLITSGDGIFEYCVAPNPGVDIYTVTPDYKVNVTNFYDEKFYEVTDYIQSDDEYIIDLPSWLKYTVVSYADEEDVEAIEEIAIEYNDEYTGTVENGTKGVIHVPFIDAESEASYVLTWDVMFTDDSTVPEPEPGPEVDEWEPIEFSEKSLTFAFTSINAQTQEVKFINHAPISYDVSSDIPTSIASLDITIPDNKDDTEGSVKITVTTLALTSADYNPVIFFVDSEDNVASLDITVSITEPSEEFTSRSFDIFYDSKAVSDPIPVRVTVNSSDVHVSLMASGDISGDINWTVSNETSGLTITPDTKTAVYTQAMDFTIKADSTVEANKTYTIRIDAVLVEAADDTVTTSNVNEAGKSAYVELNINVLPEEKAGESDPPKDDEPVTPPTTTKTFDIYYEGEAVSDSIPVPVMVNGREAHVRLVVSGDISGNINWSVSNETSGLTVNPEIRNAVHTLPIDFTVKADSTVEANKTYTVRIDAVLVEGDDTVNTSNVNEAGKSAYVTLSVNVMPDSGSPETPPNDPNKEGDSKENLSGEDTKTPSGTDVTDPGNTSKNVDSIDINNNENINYYTGVSVEAETSNFDVTNTRLTKTLLSTLGVNPSYDVAYLPASASLGSRDSVDPQEIPLNEKAVLVFPKYRVSESKVYVFGVSIKKLYQAGLILDDPIYIKMATSPYVSSLNVSAMDSYNARIIDDDGNVINVVPPLSWDKGLNIASYMKANTTYSPVITTSSSEDIGSANVGCNGGIGVLAITLLGSMLMLKKKVH